MKKRFFLMVNGDYYSSGDFDTLKKKALELAKKAKEGSALPDTGEEIKTVSICMYNISVYNKWEC